jgi:hypothetical protein
MHSRNLACERPPRPLQVRWLRTIFLDVASTPPHEEGIIRLLNNSLRPLSFLSPAFVEIEVLRVALVVVTEVFVNFATG